MKKGKQNDEDSAGRIHTHRISALIVLAVFYGIYLVKQWRQKRRGIRTIQIGRRKDTQTHTVETLMGIATAGIIPAQLLSITFGWSHLSAAFGAEYLKYRHQVLRYLGRRKG